MTALKNNVYRNLNCNQLDSPDAAASFFASLLFRGDKTTLRGIASKKTKF
jgi:hypothetical protein